MERSRFETNLPIARGTALKEGAGKEIQSFSLLWDRLLGLPLARLKKSTIRVGEVDCVFRGGYRNGRRSTGVGWDPQNNHLYKCALIPDP